MLNQPVLEAGDGSLFIPLEGGWHAVIDAAMAGKAQPAGGHKPDRLARDFPDQPAVAHFEMRPEALGFVIAGEPKEVSDGGVSAGGEPSRRVWRPSNSERAVSPIWWMRPLATSSLPSTITASFASGKHDEQRAAAVHGAAVTDRAMSPEFADHEAEAEPLLVPA